MDSFSSPAAVLLRVCGLCSAPYHEAEELPASRRVFVVQSHSINLACTSAKPAANDSMSQREKSLCHKPRDGCKREGRHIALGGNKPTCSIWETILVITCRCFIRVFACLFSHKWLIVTKKNSQRRLRLDTSTNQTYWAFGNVHKNLKTDTRTKNPKQWLDFIYHFLSYKLYSYEL